MYARYKPRHQIHGEIPTHIRLEISHSRQCQSLLTPHAPCLTPLDYSRFVGLGKRSLRFCYQLALNSVLSFASCTIRTGAIKPFGSGGHSLMARATILSGQIYYQHVPLGECLPSVRRLFSFCYRHRCGLKTSIRLPNIHN